MTCNAQMPVIVQNFIAIGQTMYEKSVTFFKTFSILAPQGAPVPKCINLGNDV